VAAGLAVQNGHSPERLIELGLSMVVDPYGRELAHTDFFRATDRTMVAQAVVGLRLELTARGFDVGPATIAWHLGREGLPVPSVSTIRRILHAAGLVVPEPRKPYAAQWRD
jgi:hypothetical protein